MTAFQTDLDQSLGELEAVTGELRASDPDELRRLEALLKRRGAAMTATLALLSAGPAPDLARHRLEAVHRAGEDLAERIRLVQAATRDRLREMHRVQFALRATSAEFQRGSTVTVVA